MTMESIAQAYRSQPFRPFTLTALDGRTIPVLRPELICFNPKGRTIIVMDDENCWDIIDLKLIVALDF
jgi:hypothetical protein